MYIYIICLYICLYIYIYIYIGYTLGRKFNKHPLHIRWFMSTYDMDVYTTPSHSSWVGQTPVLC